MKIANRALIIERVAVVLEVKLPYPGKRIVSRLVSRAHRRFSYFQTPTTRFTKFRRHIVGWLGDSARATCDLFKLSRVYIYLNLDGAACEKACRLEKLRFENTVHARNHTVRFSTQCVRASAIEREQEREREREREGFMTRIGKSRGSEKKTPLIRTKLVC